MDQKIKDYENFVKQEDILKQKYNAWREKQIAAGKQEDELLTEEQYISQEIIQCIINLGSSLQKTIFERPGFYHFSRPDFEHNPL